MLVIGGTGPMLPRLQDLVRELQLDGAVRFAGRVTEEDLPRMYAAADAFVLPTAELECFGLIALEALACGRPVLATPVGAIPEILGGVEPRWLAGAESEDAIARLLVEFLEGRLPRHEPERLRLAVAQKYSRDQTLDRLIRTTIGSAA